jgi:hypothetical protein
MHLAKLLRLDEIVSVTVPSVEREAARDLVRAREDVRGDLMRARHRSRSCCCVREKQASGLHVCVRLKIGRSAVRPRPWPPRKPQVRSL